MNDRAWDLYHEDKERSDLAKARARIAELEAANAICRTDIAALMRSADSLEARNTELEAKLRRSGQNLATVVNDKTRLEAERDRLKAALTAEREAACQFMDATTRNLYLKSRTALSDPSGETP